jgi:undecaprenyl-diphosphatase
MIPMDIVGAIVLGLIQAVTEFLPISSSAHLILFRNWIGFNAVDGLVFDVALHVGTVIALVAFFRRDIADITAGFVRSFSRRDLAGDRSQRLAWYIIAGSVPAAFVGGLFATEIEAFFRNPSTIVATLVVVGASFLVIERLAVQELDIDRVTLRMAVMIGIAQAFALIPGVSRSGITIVVGMAQRLKRAEAARFSFLLSIPIMVGAGLKEGLDLRHMSFTGDQTLLLAIGMLTSALGGWIVIKYLLRFLRSHRLDGFAYYRFALAVAVLISLLS